MAPISWKGRGDFPIVYAPHKECEPSLSSRSYCYLSKQPYFLVLLQQLFNIQKSLVQPRRINIVPILQILKLPWVIGYINNLLLYLFIQQSVPSILQVNMHGNASIEISGIFYVLSRYNIVFLIQQTDYEQLYFSYRSTANVEPPVYIQAYFSTLQSSVMFIS